jgi:hypothetical protein
MTISMADSVNPQALLGLPSYITAFAGYDDGNWPDYQAIANAHPGAHLVELTVWLANRGLGLDVEPGDATITQAPVYVTERHQAGITLPVVYCPASWSQQVLDAIAAAGIPRSSWRLLSAHYGIGQHICGPGACQYPQADGTQWIDHGTWDESLLSDDFFTASLPAPPKPAQLPQPPSRNYPGDNTMKAYPINGFTTDDAGWYAADVVLDAGSTPHDIVNVRCDWASGYDRQGWHACDASVDFASGAPQPNVARIVFHSLVPKDSFTATVWVAAP